MSYGVETVIGGGVGQLMQDMREVSPTLFTGVPHIYENIHRRLLGQLTEGAGEAGKRVMREALEQAHQLSRAIQQGEELGPLQRVARRALDPLLYQRVRRVFGGQLRLGISGGAPLGPQTAEFFHACGVLILEGWGAD